MEKNNNKRLKIAVIREELVELTGDPIAALILNQAVFAHNATETMDETTQAAIDTLKSSGSIEIAEELEKSVLRDGWFYKSPNSFFKEIMISSRSTVNRRLELLVEKGWIVRGGQYFKELKDKKGDIIQDSWWKVNIQKLRKDLFLLGYSLYNYPVWSPEEEAVENSNHLNQITSDGVHSGHPPIHHEQGHVHHEQGGVHSEQGHVQGGHQHRLLHRVLKDNNIETTNIIDDDDEKNKNNNLQESEINFEAFKEFVTYFKKNYDWNSNERFDRIYFEMQKQQLITFTIKEAVIQEMRMNEYGLHKISDYASYFVGGIIRNRQSDKVAVASIQPKIPKVEFYNWLEEREN